MTKAVNQKLVQKMLENVSVKRYGTALEVAKFVQFYAAMMLSILLVRCLQ